MLDRATVIKAPAKTAMVVIGNPAIADVSVQKNGVLVLTGKAFGETNLLAIDDQGQLVSESWLRVQGSNRNMIVYRAGEPRPIPARRIASRPSRSAIPTSISPRRAPRPRPATASPTRRRGRSADRGRRGNPGFIINRKLLRLRRNGRLAEASS